MVDEINKLNVLIQDYEKLTKLEKRDLIFSFIFTYALTVLNVWLIVYNLNNHNDLASFFNFIGICSNIFLFYLTNQSYKNYKQNKEILNVMKTKYETFKAQSEEQEVKGD